MLLQLVTVTLWNQFCMRDGNFVPFIGSETSILGRFCDAEGGGDGDAWDPNSCVLVDVVCD